MINFAILEDKDYFVELEAKKTELTMKNTAMTINSVLNDQEIGGRRTIRSILHTENTIASLTNPNLSNAALSSSTINTLLGLRDTLSSSFDEHQQSVATIRRDGVEKLEAKKIASQVICLDNNKNKKQWNPFRTCKRKFYTKVSPRQRLRLRGVIKEVFSKSSEFLRSMGLRLDQVSISTVEDASDEDKREEESLLDERNEEEDEEMRHKFKLTINTGQDAEQVRRKSSVYNLL